jgi:hypothetical protein
MSGRSTGLRMSAPAECNLLVRDLVHFIEAAPHHADVVFHHARALVAELMFQLRFDRFEQSSARPASRAITGDAAKNAPWNALPCMRNCSSGSVASSRAILNASR